jgi:hypothetical protein
MPKMDESHFCSSCGGTGIRPTDGGDYATCPRCGATVHVPGGTTIKVEGMDASEVEHVSRLLAQDAHERHAARRVGPWVSGTFYLLALLLVLAILAIVANVVSFWVFPAVIVGGLLGLSVIGALQLRQDEQLSERGFIDLMGLTLRQLPLIRAAGKDPAT